MHSLLHLMNFQMTAKHSAVPDKLVQLDYSNLLDANSYLYLGKAVRCSNLHQSF